MKTSAWLTLCVSCGCADPDAISMSPPPSSAAESAHATPTASAGASTTVGATAAPSVTAASTVHPIPSAVKHVDSPRPVGADWKAASDLPGDGEHRFAGCTLKRIREWVRADCGLGVHFTPGSDWGKPGTDYFQDFGPAFAEVRMRPGAGLRGSADDVSRGTKAKLYVAWPSDEPAPTVATLRAISPENPAFLELAPPEAIPAMPAGALPKPLPGDWAKGIPVNGAGPSSRPALCDVRVLRGWLRLRCGAPGTIPLLRGGYTNLGVKDQDFFMTSQFSTLELIVRLAPGTERSVTLDLNDKGARLAVRWPDGAPAPSEISLVNVPEGM